MNDQEAVADIKNKIKIMQEYKYSKGKSILIGDIRVFCMNTSGCWHN